MVTVRFLAALLLLVCHRDAWADLRPFDGMLEIEIANLDPIAFSAEGEVDVASDGSFSIAGGHFAGVAEREFPNPLQDIFRQLTVSVVDLSAQVGGPLDPGATVMLEGSIRFVPRLGLLPAGSALTLPLLPPFSGLATFTSATNAVASRTLTVSLDGMTSIWGVGQVIQTSVDPMGTTVMRTTTGTDQRTAMGGGTMNLVIPVAFRRSRFESDGSETVWESAVTGRLMLSVPEPMVALGEACAVAALLTAAFRARRRRVND